MSADAAAVVCGITALLYAIGALLMLSADKNSEPTSDEKRHWKALCLMVLFASGFFCSRNSLLPMSLLMLLGAGITGVSCLLGVAERAWFGTQIDD